MKTLPFKKIDAFTGGQSGGNPAGVIDIRQGESLSEAEMQTIAAQLKGFVSEVVFISLPDGNLRLKYYSSECEVAFCGHATIAILYDLLKNHGLPDAGKKVSIRVNAGTLPVYDYIEEMDAVFISAPPPTFLRHDMPTDDILAALGLPEEQFDRSLPLRLIDGGLRTLLLPLQSLSGCLALQPDEGRLKQFCIDNEFDIVHVSTAETALTSTAWRTRVFAPRFGYLEDPATGSGNAAFGYYLIDEGLWQGDISLEQGSSRDNPNIVHLKRMERDGTPSVLFGGCAVTRIEGQYYLYR